MIADYLALKKRLKKRNMEERGDLMDRHRDLEENFEPVVASNKLMVKEIVDELTPFTKELREYTKPRVIHFTLLYGFSSSRKQSYKAVVWQRNYKTNPRQFQKFTTG